MDECLQHPTVEYCCPMCHRWAEWTDGLEDSDDGEPDEFWCQTCGAETLVSGMTSRYT